MKTLFLFLFISFALTACTSSQLESASQVSSQDPVFLFQGSYSGACVAELNEGGDYQHARTDLEIHSSGRATYARYVYSQSDPCLEEPFFVVRYTFNFLLVRTGEAHRFAFDGRIEAFELILQNQQLADHLSSISKCGVTDWTVNEPRDVSGCDLIHEGETRIGNAARALFEIADDRLTIYDENSGSANTYIRQQ